MGAVGHELDEVGALANFGHRSAGSRVHAVDDAALSEGAAAMDADYMRTVSLSARTESWRPL